MPHVPHPSLWGEHERQPPPPPLASASNEGGPPDGATANNPAAAVAMLANMFVQLAWAGPAVVEQLTAAM